MSDRKRVEVAAAVITQPDGSFLLGQRAPGTFYPGYWEFPGGKVEPGEDARAALIRELDEELTELDLDAVTANPEGAAALPPAVLVRALVESHRASGRLQRRLARSRDRIARLENRIRDLKQERAYESGRLETLDRVIAALHANLEDLRLARDSEAPRVEAPPEPRVLRSASQTPALEPRNTAENA